MFGALVHASALTAHAAAFATPPLPRLQRPQVSIATPRVANPIQAVHVDLTDPNTFAVFFLWGSPVPLLFQAMIRDTEDGKDNPPGISEPFNMGYAFPSFQARMKQPTEPALLGPPGSVADRAVRWFFALNVYAGIGWYLWYKYQIEDELKKRTGEGLGGALIVLPFAVGLSLGIIGQVLYGSLETLDFFSGSFWLAFVWIYVNQFVLYEKVNKLYEDAGLPRPIATWWLIVPGLNFVTGIRQIHFLSVLWSSERGETPRPDPFCALFPFVTKPVLGPVELLTDRSLWISPEGKAALEKIRDWYYDGLVVRLVGTYDDDDDGIDDDWDDDDDDDDD